MNDPLREVLVRLQQVIAETLRDVDEGHDLELIVALICDRIPADVSGEWLLAARILMNRAVGVVEAWLDSPAIEDDVRQALLASLTILVSQGIGEELTPTKLVDLRTDLVCRRASCWEIAIPLLFVIEILTMNADPDVESLLLLG